MSTIFYGALVSPVSLTSYDALPRALLCVSHRTGDIQWIEQDVPAGSLQDVLARHGIIDMSGMELVELRNGEFLIPGFIDTHTHAPQVPNIGSGQEHELLDWLAQTTFPMEAKFADDNFAKKAYGTVVRRIIDSGTTTCCYYGTLHLGATKVLADFVHSAGQRAFVGKCNMDRNSPDYYIESSAATSVEDTKSLISYIRGLTPNSTTALVQPILTPRFAISCTPELLGSLGDVARADPTLTIQTHICENDSEIQFTKNLFPPNILPPGSEAAKKGRTTYAGVYDAYGLLRKNTVLAHAVHLEDEEVEMIKKSNAGISHCPTSNFNLRSGCARVGMLLDEGIKVGLGTDVSGGFSPSILTAVQHASIASKVVAMHHPSSQTSTTTFTSRQLPISALLYLATQGGADVCDLSKRTGSLEPGKAFDALVVSLKSDSGNPNVWGVDWDADLDVSGTNGKTERQSLEAQLERFLFTGDDRNIRRVYVQGRLIGGKEFIPSA
ncbi:guanine deaminase [Irpex rosettiformis]|uniref:Guanine deaminase n=1 Tax=Irpex rosettiformis TaxID=378272 RepID=A0ACB8UIS0_9APHY|nr:guanine deaminase [Irpex rosettiformis]